MSRKPVFPRPFPLFRALGDGTRYKIACVLLRGEQCACNIPKLVGRAQPTVSLQLKYLAKAGVVSSRRDGKWMRYRLDGKVAKFLRGAGVRPDKIRQRKARRAAMP